jgi:hypothetical protein
VIETCVWAAVGSVLLTLCASFAGDKMCTFLKISPDKSED